jgi:MSHA pilin protein MshC
MAAIAIPRFTSISTFRARVYYDEVLNSLRYARKLAVGKNLHIQVDIAASSITLRQRTEGSNCTTGTTWTNLIDPETNVSPFVKSVPAGVTLSPVMSLYFDGLGMAYLVSGTATSCGLISATTLNVTSSSLTETITITGETGYVQGSI